MTSSQPAWTSSAGMLLNQLSSLSSMIVLQCPLLCEGWGGHPLCLSGDSSVLMDLHWPCDSTAQSSILSIGSVSLILLWCIFLNVDSSCFPLLHSGRLSQVGMPCYCCSSSDFLQSHYTVLLSSFLLPFSCTSWCCCSLPCISQSLQAQIFSFSVLSFCCTDQEFLQWSRVFSSDDDISLKSHVKSLGILIDTTLSMVKHSDHISCSVYLESTRISSICHLELRKATVQLMCSFVLSWLDYCNSLLINITSDQMYCLPKIEWEKGL